MRGPLLVLWFAGRLSAQIIGANPGGVPATPQPPPSVASITAHVQLEDGSAISAAPLVRPGSCRIIDVFRGGTIQAEAPLREMGGPPSCMVKVTLAGYHPFSGAIHDGSVITLYRLREHEGSSVSITTLSAPAEAQKWYDKGEAAMTRGRWLQAQKNFEKAVLMYPKYALAWSELGAALDRQGGLEESSAALLKASEADPRYIKPIVQLAAVLEKQGRWSEELAASEAAMALHPVEFPEAYYFNAEANYHLERLDRAETALRTAVDVDKNNQFPRSHLLLGVLLARKGDKRTAVNELRLYLKMAPASPDVATVRAEINRLSQ